MSSTDISRLFDQIESFSVGFGPAFKDFKPQLGNYPPHNIVEVSDTEFYIELAVAGFKKDEVSIEMHQGQLTVRGTRSTEDEPPKYRHHGIANRTFSKSFRIAEYFEVAGASLQDGILSINFVRNVPEEAKPKLIDIK